MDEGYLPDGYKPAQVADLRHPGAQLAGRQYLGLQLREHQHQRRQHLLGDNPNTAEFDLSTRTGGAVDHDKLWTATMTASVDD